MSESIYDQIEKDIKKSTLEAFAVAGAKGVSSLVPFMGEFFNDLVPEIYRSSKQKSMIDFLNGICSQFEKDNLKSEDFANMKKELSDPGNYEYMSTILDSVFFSKSARCRVILGIICSKYMSKKDIPYEDLIIIEALKDLLDIELDIIPQIYSVATTKAKDINGEGAFYIYYDPQNVVVNTTFSKIKKLNLIGSHAEAITSKSPNGWHGNITSVTEKLVDYIEIVS